ncbi:unnamed protein product [Prunus armeniaca]|uniref:Uncharacterized protein n=1 Tax=Prunus armeniaca TaxID=36596 RepID=A0A6J5WSG0_PRUAR|nr:unnamed protein product [Prunus armeniaca]
MDMKGSSNIGVVAMMFMMVAVVMGQSVDPNFFDDSFSDVTPFKNSPPPVKKKATFSSNPKSSCTCPKITT